MHLIVKYINGVLNTHDTKRLQSGYCILWQIKVPKSCYLNGAGSSCYLFSFVGGSFIASLYKEIYFELYI